jgi:hypothetical protein
MNKPENIRNDNSQLKGKGITCKKGMETIIAILPVYSIMLWFYLRAIFDDRLYKNERNIDKSSCEL